jgi:hypothetical protein
MWHMNLCSCPPNAITNKSAEVDDLFEQSDHKMCFWTFAFCHSQQNLSNLLSLISYFNNIMKELVLDALAKTMNPTGSKNKVSFRQFKFLNQVITSKLA